MMDENQFLKDLMEVLQKHREGMASFIFAITYDSPKGIKVLSNTILPIQPRDHEENVLRDKCAKDVADLATKLTKNVYLGR